MDSHSIAKHKVLRTSSLQFTRNALATAILICAATGGTALAGSSNDEPQSQQVKEAISSAQYAKTSGMCEEDGDLSRCLYQLKKAQGRLDALGTGDKTKPAVVEAQQYVSATQEIAKARESAAKASEAARKRSRKLAQSFSKNASYGDNWDVLRVRSVLKAVLAENREGLSVMLTTPNEPKEIKRRIEKFANKLDSKEVLDFEKDCPEIKKHLTDERALSACAVVEKRHQLWENYKALAVEESALGGLKKSNALVSSLARGEEGAYRTFLESYRSEKAVLDAELGHARTLAKTLGIPLPKNAEKQWKEQYKKLQVALKSRAARKMWSGKAKSKDATVASALKRAAKAQNLRVKKQAVLSSAWSIEKSSSGIPKYRVKIAEVISQAKGESFCRRSLVHVTQDYAGGGRYAKSVANGNHFHFFTVGACR